MGLGLEGMNEVGERDRVYRRNQQMGADQSHAQVSILSKRKLEHTLNEENWERMRRKGRAGYQSHHLQISTLSTRKLKQTWNVVSDDICSGERQRDQNEYITSCRKGGEESTQDRTNPSCPHRCRT